MATSPSEKRRKALRKPLAAALALVLATLLFAACGNSSSGETDAVGAADAPDFSRAVEAAPPAIAPVYAEPNALAEGGIDAYEKQIADLEGHPIVVNKWASWCGPCRDEFPYFQDQVAERGDEVAFLGINAKDVDAAAETFLRDHSLPYLSFVDPDEELSVEIGAAPGQPVTIFYNAAGEKTYVRTGPYASEEALASDIDAYAVEG